MRFILHKRRYISLLCAIAVIFGMSVCTGVVDSAVNAAEVGPYTFMISDNTMILSGYDASKNATGEVSIKKKYSGSLGDCFVVGIKNTAFQGKSISSLEVKVNGRSDTEYYLIEDKAFMGTEIGLSSANPKAVFDGGEITAIGSHAFDGAKIGCDLEFNSINGAISSYAFKDIEIKGILALKGSIKRLGKYALEGAKMQGLGMSTNIEEIQTGAFKDTKIRAWEMPDALKKLGSKIFEGCVLETITLPSSDQEREIAEDAFPDQTGLTIIVPEGLTNLSVFHFENYKNLIFQVDSGLTENSPVVVWLRENHLSYKIGKEGEVVTPGDRPEPTEEPTLKPTEEPTVEPTQEPTLKPTEEPTIEPTEEPTLKPTEEPTPEATQEPTIEQTEKPAVEQTQEPAPTASPVSDKESETVPEKVEETSDYDYVSNNVKYKIKDDNNLIVTGVAKKNQMKLKIPDTVKISGKLYKVTEIKDKAFKELEKLETVTVGNYVKDIGNQAFAECPNLRRVQFGTRVRVLGKKIFYNDKKLTKIIFKGKKLKKIGKKTFYGVPKTADILAPRSKVEYYARLINDSKK